MYMIQTYSKSKQFEWSFVYQPLFLDKDTDMQCMKMGK